MFRAFLALTLASSSSAIRFEPAPHGLTNLNKDETENLEVKSRAFTFVVKIWFK